MNKARIRTIVSYILFLFILTIFQFSWPESITFLGIKPDLLFVFSVLTGYLYGTLDAVVIGLLAGFIRDAYAGRLLGLSMLIFMFCGIMASLFLKKILSRNILLALVQVVCASLVYTAFLTIFSYVFFSVTLSLPQYCLWMIKNQLWQTVTVNAATGVILYFLLKRFGPYRILKTTKITEENAEEETEW